MAYHEAKLLATAANRSQWPDSDLPEIIFAGRSNAGKSTLINSLCSRKNLAYAGKTPGKTRLLNFFTVDNRVVFTDAPGYGYAIRDAAAAKQFSRLIDPYFADRDQLKGLVLVLDARRKPSEDDIAMCEYGRNAHLSIIAAVTKADKLSRSQLLNNMTVISNDLGIPKSSLVPCSALKKQGIDEMWEKIDELIQKNTASE